MCTVKPSLGLNPIAAKKYIISFQKQRRSFITDVNLEDNLKSSTKSVDPEYEKLITDK